MARSIVTGVRNGFVALASLALVACATQGAKIRSNSDAAVDFAKYRSFAFVSPLGTDRANYESLVSRALKAAARRELEARGLVTRHVEPGPPVRVRYELTELNHGFGKVAEAIGSWGARLEGHAAPKLKAARTKGTRARAR